MQIIIQNYNDNLHEHQKQTKYYHYTECLKLNVLPPVKTSQ